MGLALIFFATMAMFKVFIDKQAPVQLLTAGKMMVNTQQGPMEVDTSVMANTLNLVLHGLFMFFIVAVGGRVISAGTNLIKADTFAKALKKATFDDIKKL
jgi:hypothetical protein